MRRAEGLAGWAARLSRPPGPLATLGSRLLGAASGASPRARPHGVVPAARTPSPLMSSLPDLRMRNAGLCRFQPDAAEPTARAHALAALLRECRMGVIKVASHRPGQTLWRDCWQVVAKPEEATPVRWR